VIAHQHAVTSSPEYRRVKWMIRDRLINSSTAAEETKQTKNGAAGGCPFRKFHPEWIGTVGQNHRIFER
jgi:hypothetical protein